MTKRVLAIFVWYRSMHGGGLHENIRDSINAANKIFDRIVVVCPVSWFSEQYLEAGAEVLEVDFASISPKEILEKIGSVNFVHVHPGQSRVLGIKLAKLAKVPVVMTIHGAWFDGVDRYWSDLYRVIAVSQSIEFEIRKKIPEIRHKLISINNGVDLSCFSIKSLPERKKSGFVCVSRFDVDKEKLLSFVAKFWEFQAKTGREIQWTLAGDGPSRKSFIDLGVSLIGERNINYLGWVQKSELAAVYRDARLAVAPGRSAIEALASGTSVISIGSSGGHVFVRDVESFHQAMFSNFGGYGTPTEEIIHQEIFDFYEQYHEFIDKNIFDTLKSYVSLDVINSKLEKVYFEGLM